MSVQQGKKPTATTTISTVAVQSGKARIVLAVLQSAEWIQVRVEDMIPRMTEIGTNLEEAQNLKTQHEEVIKNLVAKQDQIGSLLTQADNQVSTQQFYGDVYAAMAKSLGQAWKDLTRQMETRQKLLDQAVDFYRGAKQYNDNLADGIRECRTLSQPSDPRDVERQQQRTRQIKKDMLEGSMQVMSKGRDLLDRLHDLGSKAGDDSRHATMVSCQGVEKAMEDIQDKRRLLDDLWLERSRKLDQYQHLRDIDTEVTKISNWFRTQGEMYLQKRNIGRSENECSDLLKQHHAFEVAAGDVQNSVANLLATSEQVRHSDPESTERLRSQTRAIDTLCDDFMHRLGERRNTLQRAHDFYRNAELAKTYLSRLGVQLSQERLPKDEWSRTNRLDKLNNAISEISTPVLGEGRALLNQVGLSTPGAETVKENMAEIQAKCVDLQNQARPELREQAEMQATFEEKYTVLIKWLVNVGDAFLMANNDMGDQMQTTMDFLDGHEKLLTEVREKSTQVDNVMAIATKLGSKNRFTPEQTNKLKQHWTRVTVTVENRIRAAHIFIKFHKVAKQLGNAMENMETMLKSEEMRDVKRMKKTTMQHIHEKWNQMVEINIQLDNTGHTFKNELHKLVNDTELVTKTSVHYVELTIKSFGERKIYLDDLYDSLHQKYSAEETFKSQWEHFVRDARKTIEFVINMEGNVFPRLTADAQSLADVKQKKIDSFQETVTKVTTEIQMRLKTAEMLGAKGDTGGEKEQVVERLTSAHHRFMNRVGEYQIVLTLSIDFYKKVNKVNKTMDEAIASYQVQPAPSHTSEAQIRLQQHEEEKRYITELYTTAAKKGDEVIAKIRQSDPVSPARRDVEVTLQAMEERKEHWLNEWSRYRQRLTKASEDTSLKLLKSEFIIHLQRAEDELDGMRKSKESVSLTIEKFTDWEAQIKVLEDQYQHYLSTAHIALKGKPADKPGIQKDIQEVQTYWTSFMKNVDDYRKKMELVVNLRKQYTTLVSNLKLADRQLQDLQQPQVSETLTIEKFQDWQVHIKGLEKEYTNYVSRANIVLDQKPPASTLIERELNEVKNFWVGFNKSVQDYRDKMQLVANIRMQYKTLIMNMEQAEDDLKDLESTPHSSSLIIEKHENWEAHIKVLEDEYKKYVSSAHIALDRRPPSAGVIEKDLAEAERYWSKLNRQINDYRHKVEVIFNIHKRFKTLAVRIQKATKHVEELKTDFGEKAEDLPEIQKKFATFEQDIKPLEVEHRDFVTVATVALAKNPPNASAIKRDVDDINRFWSKLNVSLQDQRKKLKTAPKFHELYKTVVEWQVKAEDLLVAVGQKKPLFTAQEQAAEVLGEVEDFIEKGDARQKARLFKLNEMAIDLYSHKVPPRVTSTIKTNRELLDAIQVTNDELFALANNLPKQTPVQAKADETVVPQVQRTVQTVPLVKSQKPVPAPPGLVDESVLPVSQKPVETKPWQPPPPPKAVQESVVPQYQKPAQMKQWKAPRPVRQVAEIILPDEQTSDAEIPLDRLPETSTKTVQLVQPESPITQTRKEPLEAFPTFPAPEPEPPKPVGYAPYFTRKIRDNLVKQGRATQLDCVVKGDPAPEVQWYKDDVPVRTSNNLRVECGDEGLCALSFYNTQPEAAGVYTMKAFNVIGEAACKAKLNVQAVQEEFVLPKQVPKVSTGHIQLTHNALMPKFIQIPGDKNVEEGKPLCLEVMVDAYPDPNVVWSKDGIKVKGEPYILKEDGKTHTLIIPEADLEDEGIFICTATNPAGRAECIIQVKVNEAEEPPVFITPLVNAQAKKGAPFAFECVLKGDPVPVVEWLKNNKPVNADNPDYNLKRNTETGTCRLEIDEVFPEDAARYTCRATNEAGKAETTSMLSVMEDASPTPPWIQPLKLESSYLEIPVDQPIKLAFKVSGNPEPTVTWHHNDRPLRPDGRIKVVKEDTTYTMQISQAEPEDTGKYTIRAENEKGQESSSVEINVPRPPVVIPIHQEEVQSAPAPAAKTPPGTAPRFKTRLKDLVIPDGQPFELTCKVAGMPVPNIVWYKDNKELTENEPQYELSFMESVARLDVREAFLEDAGLYTCQATNNHGRDVTSGRVEVKSLPQAPPVIKPISHESSHLDIPVGQPIVLKFNIEAFPPPVVRWYHDGVPVKETPEMEIINEETDYKLVIKEAKPEYAGTYTVVAENDKGQESTSIEIDVVPPETQMEVVPTQAEPTFAPLQSRFFTQPDAMPLMGAATPPRFQSRLKDIEVTEGEPIEIAIRVTGQPTPRITWYKDDKPIAGKPQYEMSFVESVARLDVREAFLEDEGRYVCKATNPAGQDTTTCQITVKVNAALVPAPHITPLQTQYSHLDIPVGQPIRLHFRIRGQPPPKVTWLQNDVEIVETEEVEIIKEETVHTLVIKNPRPDAGGKYTVVAENDRGTETVNIVINVSGVTVPMPTGPGPVVVRPAQPIVFTEHLTDKQVVESTEIKLRVRIEEKPSAQVQWFFNNTPIQPSDRVEFLRDGDVYYLVIKKPTSGDAGLYQCRAETEVSVVTTECTIMVNEKQSPDFIAPLESVVASEGCTIRLECRVSGSPAPTVKWTKDERSITETSRVRFLTEGDRQILMILQVRPSDSGNYRITLTNEFGVSVSSATLLVDGEKDVDDRPTIVIRLNDQEVQPGDRVQFRVKIQGTPQPTVQWFKNSIEIQTHPYIEISQTGEHNMLTIPKVGPQDAGTYSVVATNDKGRDVSAATLVVDVPKTPTAAPHFAQTFGNRRCYEGESLTFECRITGDPKPSVSWFKDGVKVEQGVFQISEDGQFHKLEILEVFDEDAGVFECRAKNDYGEAICVATLRIKGLGFVSEEDYSESIETTTTTTTRVVYSSTAMSRGRIGQEEAPKFTQPLKSVSVKEGQTATLQAELKGQPEPTVKWFKDDKELKSSPKYNISFAKGKCMLKVSKASAKDDGQYKCTAENKCGNAMCSATLQIQGTAPTEEVKPQPPPQEQQVQQQPQQKEESAPPPEEKKAEQPQQPPPQPQPEVKPPAPQAEVKKPEAEVKIPPPQPQPQVQQQPQQQVQQEPAQPKPQVQQKQPPPPAQKAEPPKQQPPPATQKVEQPKPPAAQVQQTIEIKMAAPTEAAAPKPSAPPPPAVTSGPVFTKTLSDITVKEGNTVKLECAVKGQPQPDVKWYREGALMTPSPDFEVKYQNGVSTLTILEIFYDDAGQYACSATNSKGTKSTSCNVRVLPGTPPPSAQQAQQPPAQVNAVNDTAPAEKIPIGPPEFSKPLLPARYSEGGRCRFACTVKGNPAPKITWLRQGQPIESGYRFVIKYDEKTGSATLDITMMLPEDKGEYTCIAKSKAGQVYLTAPLLPPAQYDHWAQEYEEQKAIEKAKKKKDVVNKELETKVHEKGGKITPSQATYHDADQTSKLSPFERRLLREVEIREMESGPRGGPFSDQDSKASSFESRLEKEIKFRERKSSQDYDATDAGPFDVAAFEASLLNQKQPQESESMEAETETELESELETSEASQQRAPRFLKELKNFRVSEGGKIALSCRVEGRPKPSIQWFKDGYPVPKSIRYDVSYMEGFSQFRIDPILPEDKGAYTIFAWNQFGKAVNTGRIKVDRHLSDEVSHMKGALGARVSMETEEYHLPDRERQPGEVREKHYKPTFKVIPSDLEVKEGKLARFNCRVTGRPPPDLVWYRNEMPVYPDANHRVIVNEGGEHALMISHARPQDGGMYTCIASNRAGEAKFQVKLHVDPKRQLVAPSFIDRIENATVRENEAVTLTCKVTGCPTPHVSWQRDQKHIMPNAGGYRMQMSEDGVCQLFIERVTRHDSAWYTCTAHNSAGRVSCRSRVQVIYDKLIKDNEPAPIFQRRPTQSKKPPPPPEQEEIPSYVTQYDGTPETDKKSSVKPEFVVPLNDNMKKKEGSSAHFACRLQPAGDPTMRIEWFKNNTPLFIGSRVQTKYEFGICSLDIKGVYPEDAGTITCRATNKYGQTETTGKLTCEAEQSLILDTQLPEEMRGIEKTIKFDEYLSAGDFPDDSKFPSEEFSRPELVTVPEPVSILEGENARFSCRISGVPAPRVSWFREDLQIIGQGARMRSWFDGIHYMEITKARVGDSGVIRLVARNKLGMVEFKTKLEVKPKDVPPPLLKPTPKEEKVPQPKPKIPGLQKTQAAKPQYQQPTQTMQPAAAAQPMEMMQLAPCFLSAPPPMTVGAPGEPVRLSCRVGGNPVPKVIWSKDGRLLTSVPRMKILQDEDIHTLLILECLPEDAGNYTIEIVGPSGKKTHCFRIQIQGDKPDDFEPHYPEVPHHHPEVQPIGFATLPEFRSVLTDCLVPDGSPVELACEVVGTPPPVINWYHNGGIIKPSRYFRMSYDDGIARLQINEVFQEDGGEYVCEAFNNAGRISCSGILNVQVEEIESAAEFAVPPKFLKKIVNLEVAEGSPARFECKVVGSPRPEVQWFHEGKLIQSMPHKRVSTGSDGTSTLYIPQVLADDSGRISVTASNPAGQVTCSSQLLVEDELPKPGEKAEIILPVEQEAPKDIEIIISPPEFVQPIVDIEVVEGDDVKFLAQVTGSQPITITWYQETKPIQESPEFRVAFDGKTCTLEVPEVLPEDAGKYTCKASNPAGEVTSTAVLTIKDERPQRLPLDETVTKDLTYPIEQSLPSLSRDQHDEYTSSSSDAESLKEPTEKFAIDAILEKAVPVFLSDEELSGDGDVEDEYDENETNTPDPVNHGALNSLEMQTSLSPGTSDVEDSDKDSTTSGEYDTSASLTHEYYLIDPKSETQNLAPIIEDTEQNNNDIQMNSDVDNKNEDKPVPLREDIEKVTVGVTEYASFPDLEDSDQKQLESGDEVNPKDISDLTDASSKSKSRSSDGNTSSDGEELSRDDDSEKASVPERNGQNQTILERLPTATGNLLLDVISTEGKHSSCDEHYEDDEDDVFMDEKREVSRQQSLTDDENDYIELSHKDTVIDSDYELLLMSRRLSSEPVKREDLSPSSDDEDDKDEYVNLVQEEVKATSPTKAIAYSEFLQRAKMMLEDDESHDDTQSESDIKHAVQKRNDGTPQQAVSPKEDWRSFTMSLEAKHKSGIVQITRKEEVVVYEQVLEWREPRRSSSDGVSNQSDIPKSIDEKEENIAEIQDESPDALKENEFVGDAFAHPVTPSRSSLQDLSSSDDESIHYAEILPSSLKPSKPLDIALSSKGQEDESTVPSKDSVQRSSSDESDEEDNGNIDSIALHFKEKQRVESESSESDRSALDRLEEENSNDDHGDNDDDESSGASKELDEEAILPVSGFSVEASRPGEARQSQDSSSTDEEEEPVSPHSDLKPADLFHSEVVIPVDRTPIETSFVVHIGDQESGLDEQKPEDGELDISECQESSISLAERVVVIDLGSNLENLSPALHQSDDDDDTTEEEFSLGVVSVADTLYQPVELSIPVPKSDHEEDTDDDVDVEDIPRYTTSVELPSPSRKEYVLPIEVTPSTPEVQSIHSYLEWTEPREPSQSPVFSEGKSFTESDLERALDECMSTSDQFDSESEKEPVEQYTISLAPKVMHIAELQINVPPVLSDDDQSRSEYLVLSLRDAEESDDEENKNLDLHPMINKEEQEESYQVVPELEESYPSAMFVSAVDIPVEEIEVVDRQSSSSSGSSSPVMLELRMPSSHSDLDNPESSFVTVKVKVQAPKPRSVQVFFDEPQKQREVFAVHQEKQRGRKNKPKSSGTQISMDDSDMPDSFLECSVASDVSYPSFAANGDVHFASTPDEENAHLGASFILDITDPQESLGDSKISDEDVEDIFSESLLSLSEPLMESVPLAAAIAEQEEPLRADLKSLLLEFDDILYFNQMEVDDSVSNDDVDRKNIGHKIEETFEASTVIPAESTLDCDNLFMDTDLQDTRETTDGHPPIEDLIHTNKPVVGEHEEVYVQLLLPTASISSHEKVDMADLLKDFENDLQFSTNEEENIIGDEESLQLPPPLIEEVQSTLIEPSSLTLVEDLDKDVEDAVHRDVVTADDPSSTKVPMGDLLQDYGEDLCFNTGPENLNCSDSLHNTSPKELKASGTESPIQALTIDVELEPFNLHKLSDQQPNLPLESKHNEEDITIIPSLIHADESAPELVPLEELLQEYHHVFHFETENEDDEKETEVCEPILSGTKFVIEESEVRCCFIEAREEQISPSTTDSGDGEEQTYDGFYATHSVTTDTERETLVMSRNIEAVSRTPIHYSRETFTETVTSEWSYSVHETRSRDLVLELSEDDMEVSGSLERYPSFVTPTKPESEATFEDQVTSMSKDFPFFAEELCDLVVDVGDMAIFQCHVGGEPSPDVTWYRDGQPLKAKENVSFQVLSFRDRYAELVINPANLEDEGQYTAEATNIHGSTASSAYLTVRASDCSEDEENAAVPTEDSTASGSDESHSTEDETDKSSPDSNDSRQSPTQGDLKDGSSPQTGDTVSITSSQLPLSMSKDNSVDPVPDIQLHTKTPLTNFHGALGENPEQELKQETLSAGDNVYDSKPGSDDAPLHAVDDLVESVLLEEQELHGCLSKAFPSSPGEKGDEEKPVEDVSKPKDEKKPETKELKPEVEEKTEILTQEILVEKTPKEILAEELEEAARGEQPELMPPKFIKSIETVVAGDGDAVKFSATVTGKPRPDVTWYVDDTEIKDEPEYEVAFTDDGIASLFLPEVIPEDEGMYLCKAVNVVGEATCSAELFVEEESSTEVDTEVEIATTQQVVTVTKEVQQTVIEEEVTEEMPVAEVKIEALETVMVIEPTEPQSYIAIGNYLAESDEVMSMREGEQLTILDDGHGEWWMARRETTGEEGWVPKGYLATPEQYDEHLRQQLEEVVKEMSIDELVPPSNAGTPFKGKAIAPEIIEPLQTTKAKDGKPVTLQCRIKGTPMPTVAWFRQSTQIPATEEFKMATDGDIVTLTIEEVYPEDSGKYTCVAKNQGGTASTSAELLVEVALSDAESDGTPSRKSLSRESTIEEGEGIKPAFMTVAKSQVVSAGKEKVTFEFRLIAAPRPQIQWFKDDQPLEETPRRRMSMYADVHLYILTLELTDIEPDDEGKYRIVATNKEGKAVASVSLEVTREEPEPPKFIEPIQTATVTQGDLARFECVVTGRPMPEITWFHGEKMIKPSNLIEIGQDKEGKNWVVVRQATPELLGTYTCWAENQVGRTMCGAELTLTSEAEEISIVSVDSSAIVEGPQSRDLVSIDFEGVDELEEEGVPPTFVMPVQDVEVKPGETAHLRVKVAGKPTPEVTWYRDGKVLQPSPRHTIMSDTEGNASLVISEAIPGDDADYLCKAVNPFGIVSCRADVIVDEEPSEVKKDKPAILVQAEKGIPLEAQPQGPVEVTLEVRGKDLEIASISEAPSITSEEALETDIEEKELDEAEAAVPEVHDEVQIEIQLEDLEKHPEEVIVEVTKKMEEKPLKQEVVMPVEVTPTKEEVTLAPTEVPEQKAPVFTQPLTTAELKPGETAEVTCKVEGHPRPEVQWFVDDKVIEPDSHYQTEHRPDGVCVLTIHDVESMDEGQYVVRAINPVGVASTESELFVEVPGKMAPVKVEAKATMEVEKPLETVPKQEAAVVEEQVVPMEKKPTEAAPEIMPQFQVEPTQREITEVYEAPKFVEDMVDLEIIKGHPARFDVQVSGIPMPTLHWYRNGKEIKPDDKHVKFEFAEDEGIGSLIIDEVRADDDAEYACKASNKAGSAVSKADLFLQAAHKKRPEKHPPKFIIEMKTLTAVEGDSINFFCKVVGRPMPEIRWFKNGVELKLGPRISIDYDEQGMCTLLIRNTTMDDVATYTCKAINEIGEATTTAELILEGTLHHHIVEHKNSVYRIYL